MKFFHFFQLCIISMLLAGCTGKFTPEAYLAQFDNHDLPEVWNLQDCLKRAPDAPAAGKTVIRNYFALGAAQLMDAELSKKISTETDPVKKGELQKKMFDVISGRSRIMVELCDAMQIYPGTQLVLDIKLPDKLKPLISASKKELEKAALLNCKEQDPARILKQFHQIYFNMYIAREKFEFYQQAPDSVEKKLQLIQSYADCCRYSHELALLCDLPVSLFI